MLKSNCIKKLIILLAAGLFTGILSAQQQDPDEVVKRALEREIKVSGNYLYGEAVGNTKDETIQMAKTALVSEINKEVLNHPEWQFAESIQAKVEYNIDMIDLMRGNKFRVIAYIKKDNIAIVFDNKTPVITLADEKVQQEKEQISVQEEKPQPVAEQIVTPALVHVPTEEKVQSKEEEEPEQLQPVLVVDNSKNAGGLLEQILQTNSMREIQTMLVENKRIGKVAYGTMDKLTAPEKAYLIVYKRTGEIVAILDKGSSNNRKDLRSNETKSNEILQQNQIIWFQLF